MNMPARSPEALKRRRRRATLTMRIVTGMCALAGIGIGANQLASTSVQAFLDRPPGVGATPGSEAVRRLLSAAGRRFAATGPINLPRFDVPAPALGPQPGPRAAAGVAPVPAPPGPNAVGPPPPPDDDERPPGRPPRGPQQRPGRPGPPGDRRPPRGRHPGR